MYNPFRNKKIPLALEELNAKANDHLIKKGQFFSRLPGIMLLFLVILGSVYVYSVLFTKADPDGIYLNQIEDMRKDYDFYWKSEGKPLAEQKTVLYQQQSEVDTKLQKMRDDIKKIESKVDNKNRIKVWEPEADKYYKDNKDKLYRIISVTSAIGGGDTAISQVYKSPQDLFYTCLKADGCYVSQTDREHFLRNGYLATDIGTNSQNIAVHVPDWQNKELTYTAKYIEYPKTTGDTVELTTEYEGTKIMWRIGHLHWLWNETKYKDLFDGKQVKTGDVIAYSGGEKEESIKNGGTQGATTGKHVHIEYLVWDGLKYAPTPYRIGETINVHRTANDTRDNVVLGFPRKVEVTTYNPTVAQNDSDPFHGASGALMKEGMIALSRDLINHNAGTGYNKSSPIKYGSKVHLESSNPKCSGDYEVQDTMNIRYKDRADIFKMNSKDNTSCTGTITLL